MRALHGGLILRPLNASDAPVLASWAADETFRRAAGWSADRPYEDLVLFWQRMATAPPAELIRLAAVVDGELVGHADLHGSEPERRELGFLVGPSSRWGQRLGLAIAAKALSHAWQSTAVHEVWAEAHPANQHSLRILESIGMSYVGLGDEEDYLGVQAPMRRYSIERARWFAAMD